MDVDELDDLSRNMTDGEISEIEELGTVLFVKTISALLKDDEGVVIHHDDKGYVVFKNSVQGTISIMGDEDYLEMEHGTLIWMHYEDGGGEAPEPEFDDLIVGKNEKLH